MKKFKALAKSDNYDVTNSNDSEKEIVDILSDDLNTPEAIKYLSSLAKSARKNKDDLKKLVISAKFIGLDLLRKDKTLIHENIDEIEIEKLIQERLESRLKGDYEKADKIREKLLSMKIHIKDLEGTTVWDYNPD